MKPAPVLVAFELDNEDIMQKPLTLVTELNTCIPGPGLGETERESLARWSNLGPSAASHW